MLTEVLPRDRHAIIIAAAAGTDSANLATVMLNTEPSGASGAELVVVDFISDGRLGISFDVLVLDEDEEGDLCIQAIAPGSLAAAKAELHPGLVLKCIQAQNVVGLDANDVLDLLRSSARPLSLSFAESGLQL